MNKLILFTFLILYFSHGYAQQDIMIFKKGENTVATFRQDSYIAFQEKNHQWSTGYITKVQHDSFFIKPMVVHYNLGSSDTIYYPVLPFAVSDIYAMPKKGVQIDFINGRFQITTSGGHVHWYWVKSGWVFMVGGAGYIVLNVLNGLIKNDFKFSGSKISIAAAVIVFGELLHLTYKPTLPIGRKYHFLTVSAAIKNTNAAL